jgi:hypothetical protein
VDVFTQLTAVFSSYMERFFNEFRGICVKTVNAALFAGCGDGALHQEPQADACSSLISLTLKFDFL